MSGVKGGWVITFPSQYYVFKAEKCLKSANIKMSIIPTPREISSDCGMAIAVEDKDRAEGILRQTGVKYEGIFYIK